MVKDDWKAELIEVYRKRAKNYDFTANLYYLVGYREYHYRKRAVDALELKPGDQVLEVGCGTGLNFPYLLERIGRDGKVIGVDLSAAMLEQAAQRVEDAGWDNVKLVETDIAKYEIPPGMDAAFSSYAGNDIAGSIREHFDEEETLSLYFGISYLCIGRKSPD